MVNVTIDFETRSKVDLKVQGLYRYAQAASTDVLCMAYRVERGEVDLWRRGDPFPEQLRELIKDGCLMHAHNAGFEKEMWRYIMAARHGWPEIALEQWRCTAAKAAYANLPRDLNSACGRVLPSELHKDDAGHKLMMKMCKPNRKGEWIEDEESLLRLYEYCKQDVRAESELDAVLPDWPESEVRVWQINERVNERGVPIDVPLCSAASRLLDTTLESLSQEIQAATRGKIKTGGQILAIREYIAEQGISMSSLSAECVRDTLEQPDLPDTVTKVLQLRQLSSGAAAKKYASALGVTDGDERARGLFMYYAASTGRFASMKTQFHNMKKGGDKGECFTNAMYSEDPYLLDMLYGDNMIDVLGKNVRQIVKMPPGFKLLRADESQIECRITHWLAGDTDMLDMFDQGLDPYIEFAQKAFSKPVVHKGDKERAIGKAAVLGLGFGMGAAKFQGSVKTQAGIEINMKFAKMIVDFYRKSNPKITALWKNLEASAIRCVEQGTTTRCGRVVFRMEDDNLTIGLPSGRKLYYPRPSFDRSSRGPRFVYWSPRGARYEWAGGLLTENLAQAIARDILVVAMHRAEKHGLEIFMHVHDEIMAQVPIAEVESASKIMHQCMVEPLSWTEGLPLGAEVKEAIRYA